MSRMSAGLWSGVGFIAGGVTGAAIGGRLHAKTMYGAPTKQEVERMSVGALIGAFIGAVSGAAVGTDTPDDKRQLPPPRFP